MNLSNINNNETSPSSLHIDADHSGSGVNTNDTTTMQSTSGLMHDLYAQDKFQRQAASSSHNFSLPAPVTTNETVVEQALTSYGKQHMELVNIFIEKLLDFIELPNHTDICKYLADRIYQYGICISMKDSGIYPLLLTLISAVENPTGNNIQHIREILASLMLRLDMVKHSNPVLFQSDRPNTSELRTQLAIKIKESEMACQTLQPEVAVNWLKEALAQARDNFDTRNKHTETYAQSCNDFIDSVEKLIGIIINNNNTQEQFRVCQDAAAVFGRHPATDRLTEIESTPAYLRTAKGHTAVFLKRIFDFKNKYPAATPHDLNMEFPGLPEIRRNVLMKITKNDDIKLWLALMSNNSAAEVLRLLPGNNSTPLMNALKTLASYMAGSPNLQGSNLPPRPTSKELCRQYGHGAISSEYRILNLLGSIIWGN
jgi:hypothetical protein